MLRYTQGQEKKRKKIYTFVCAFCKTYYINVYICLSNQQNRNAMKKENKNQAAKELVICLTIAAVVSLFIVQFITSHAPAFNW